MKQYFKRIMPLLMASVMVFALSCSSENEPGENVPSDLIGTWVIQHTSRISTTYTFNGSGTGTYTFSGNSSFYTFPYTFTVSGKKIKIKGVYVNDEGTVDKNWHKEGTFSGGVLKIGDDTLTKR